MPKTAPKKEIQTPPIRVLKKASCKSTSGNSNLTYHIGCSEDGAIYISIHDNDGGGFWSREYVAFKDIQDALENASNEHDSLTSIVLQPLFQGKSVNTPSFLLAALANERVIVPQGVRKRHFELGYLDEFLEKVNKLMTSKQPSRKTSTKKKTTTKKAALKKKRSATTAK